AARHRDELADSHVAGTSGAIAQVAPDGAIEDQRSLGACDAAEEGDNRLLDGGDIVAAMDIATVPVPLENDRAAIHDENRNVLVRRRVSRQALEAGPIPTKSSRGDGFPGLGFAAGTIAAHGVRRPGSGRARSR